MNKRIIVLLITLAGFVLFIASRANEPNAYLSGVRGDGVPQPYPWQYPAWLVAFGLVTIGSVSLRKPLTRLIGVLISFVFSACLVVLLAMSVMHSPPVHFDLLYVMFFASLGLLFYLGYTFAVWRQQAGDADSLN